MTFFRAKTTFAIGVGCRKGVSADAIVALAQEAMSRAGIKVSSAVTLFTIIDKQGEAALYEASAILAIPLVFLPRAAMVEANDLAIVRSQRVVDLFGVSSVAETAALAGAKSAKGEDARLIAQRFSRNGVTCAVASAGVATSAVGTKSIALVERKPLA